MVQCNPTSPPSNGSSVGSADSTPASQLPDYNVAIADSNSSYDATERIAATLQNASSKLCNGPSLTNSERKELYTVLNEGVRIGLSHAVPHLCSLSDLRYYLTVLNLFDRLREAVQNGTEYFDYPTVCQEDVHVDEPGITAPPPPYAPKAEPPPSTTAEADRQPTKEEARLAAAELSEQLQKERRWCIYLNRAAYRLELWFSNILSSETTSSFVQPYIAELQTKSETRVGVDLPDYALPPIDVALLLHAYYLHPLSKEEATLRLPTRRNLALFNFPLRQIAERVDPLLPILNNVEPARQFWEDQITSKRSKQPWDLGLQPPTGYPTNSQEIHGGTIFGLRIGCPRCKAIQFVPWTGIGKEPTQVGIGETGWQRACANSSGGCPQITSAEHLSTLR